MEKVLEEIKKLTLKIEEQNLKIQQLEAELEKFKNGDFGSGIFLDGCSEADIQYITSKQDKKVGA